MFFCRKGGGDIPIAGRKLLIRLTNEIVQSIAERNAYVKL